MEGCKKPQESNSPVSLCVMGKKRLFDGFLTGGSADERGRNGENSSILSLKMVHPEGFEPPTF